MNAVNRLFTLDDETGFPCAANGLYAFSIFSCSIPRPLCRYVDTYTLHSLDSYTLLQSLKMPLLPTSMKPRSFLSILLVIGLITTLYFYKRTSSSLYEPLVNYEAVAHKPEGFSNQDALRLKIEQYLQSHLTDLQAPFNSTEDEALLGLKLQGKPIHLDAYRAELLDNYHKYLSPASPSSPPHLFLSLVLSRLSLTPPSSHLPLRPETITTTDAHRSLVPWEFSRWKEICPDWEVRVFEDDDMYDWMERVFGGSMGRKVWEELPRVVLKTDIFRLVESL
jgi:hypothetical protein